MEAVDGMRWHGVQMQPRGTQARRSRRRLSFVRSISSPRLKTNEGGYQIYFAVLKLISLKDAVKTDAESLEKKHLNELWS
jgi:hypothetical protein